MTRRVWSQWDLQVNLCSRNKSAHDETAHDETETVFSNRKMRLKLSRSGGGFGSTVYGLEHSFSNQLDLFCGFIIAHGVGLVFEPRGSDAGFEVILVIR